jgi:hypothetical protein
MHIVDECLLKVVLPELVLLLERHEGVFIQGLDDLE